MTTLYWLLVILMALGAVGAMIPSVPGASLIVIAILVWGGASGFSGLGVALAVAIAVLFLSVAIDLLSTYWGAKQAGASKWGQIGAIVGLLLGMFGLLPAWLIGGPIWGIIVGALLGAIVGEYLYQRDLAQAFKAGIAVVVSSAIGNLIQGLLAIAAVVAFIMTTSPSS